MITLTRKQYLRMFEEDKINYVTYMVGSVPFTDIMAGYLVGNRLLRICILKQQKGSYIWEQ